MIGEVDRRPDLHVYCGWCGGKKPDHGGGCPLRDDEITSEPMLFCGACGQVLPARNAPCRHAECPSRRPAVAAATPKRLHEAVRVARDVCLTMLANLSAEHRTELVEALGFGRSAEVWRVRASRLRDALMFATADLPHAPDCSQDADCYCWRKEAESAIDEARDADLCTEVRDLRDANEALIALIARAVAEAAHSRECVARSPAQCTCAWRLEAQRLLAHLEPPPTEEIETVTPEE